MSSSRVGLRFFQNSRAAFRNATAPFRRPARRFQSTESAAPAPEQSQSTFSKLWNSPVGMKTVHFWAPVMKWTLVLAGISDLTRPPEKLSLTQNLALMGTGTIWTRWCFIIKPKNILLAAVNFFLACTGLTQVTRIFLYRRSQDGSAKEAAKDIAHETADGAKQVVEAVESKVKSG